MRIKIIPLLLHAYILLFYDYPSPSEAIGLLVLIEPLLGFYNCSCVKFIFLKVFKAA